MEYLQNNYLEVFTNSVEEYIKENELGIKEDGEYDSYTICTVEVMFSQFTKSQIDKLEFIVFFRTKFSVTNNKNPEESKKEFDLYFSLKMKGSFEEGFVIKSKKEEAELCEPDYDKLTSGLVPVIKETEYDNKAIIFLKELYPEALETPMMLPIKDMMRRNKMSYHFARLEKGVQGKIYFAKDKAKVYVDETLTEEKEISVKPGTILVDVEKAQNKGSFRNTIIHECVHWFYHTNYFELNKKINSDDTCAVCYKSSGDIISKDVYWMEWQANHLAPRILMPKKMFMLKVKEIQSQIDKENTGKEKLSRGEKWEMLIERLAEFFGVTVESARIRLIETGWVQAEGVKRHNGQYYLKPYFHKKGALGPKESFFISTKDFLNICKTSPIIKAGILNQKIIFVENKVVICNPKYVDIYNNELTEYGRNNVHECCLVFQYKSEMKNHSYNNCYITTLNSTGCLSNRRTIISLNQLQSMYTDNIEDLEHYKSHRANLPDSIGGTIEYHLNKCIENEVFYNKTDLEAESGIDHKTINKYISGKSMPSLAMVLKLGLSMHLSSPYIKDMLNKINYAYNNDNNENLAIRIIITNNNRVGIKQAYIEFKELKMEHLLEPSKSFLEYHYLIN